MRLTTAISTGVLVTLAAASPAKLRLRDAEVCSKDALCACFASLLSQASAYCTNSITMVAQTTNTVTITPTVTVIDAVTETATEVEGVVNKTAARRKEGSCHANKPPLACVASLPTAAIQPAQFTSACSCIGVTTATVTADTLYFVVETRTAMVTVTDSATQTDVVTVTEISTSTEPVPTPAVTPVIINGDFETGTLDGWGVISATGDVAGTRYRLTFQIIIVSSYTNGNPWSVTLGGVTLVSGAGSYIAPVQYWFPVTCGATAASNTLAFRLQSNTNRAARLLVDNGVEFEGLEEVSQLYNEVRRLPRMFTRKRQ
ncbi:hypothetical protein N657DRAFT_635602 [Parathielavia appendiculata]|uniref:Uncharacterized protein n=1 Tax=Parathielavia appendiculata TaxID=2587402 RepID=A0AAN6TWT8_9PEZI|nr:hypothetical protein N657DRAFT_635602 [Parathielavia appendiculata]